MFKKYILTLLTALITFALSAQDDKKWDVSNPGPDFNYQSLSFSTDEGIWMNHDVSPDGKTIVFDMLGDIYSIPAAGGTAKILRPGIPFEIQPRFSADGK